MKFSIRDLLLVTVIVALVLGWWVDRSRLAADNKRFRQQENFGSFFQMARSGVNVDPAGILPNSSAPAPRPPKP